jgi:hypothetical protein
VPQGVHVGIIPKGLDDFSIKLRRDRIFDVVKEKLKRASALKYWKKAQQCWFAGGPVSRRNTLFISQESSRRNLMVKILHGEFMKSWKPSNLVEEQEGYGVFFCFSSGVNRVIGSLEKCKVAREVVGGGKRAHSDNSGGHSM